MFRILIAVSILNIGFIIKSVQACNDEVTTEHTSHKHKKQSNEEVAKEKLDRIEKEDPMY